MADEIAKIGLDTADMARGIDRISGQLDRLLGGAAKKADKEVNKLSKSMRALGNSAKAALGLAGLGGFAAAARSIKELNSDLEETRSHLKTGSKEAMVFDETVKSVGTDALTDVKKASNIWDAMMAHMKLSTAKAGVAVAKAVGIDVDQFGDATKPGGLSIEDIQRSRDALSAAKAGSSNTEGDKLSIMAQEVMLQEDLIEYYSQGAAKDEVRRKEAAERLQIITAEYDLASDAFSLSEKKAKVEGAAVKLEMQGMGIIMSRDKIIAEYEERITKARREGRIELEKQLTIQQDQALIKADAANARQTPRDRLQARRDARLEMRDANRMARREEQFKRWDDAGRVGGKGSQFAAWQAKKEEMKNKPPVVAVGGEAVALLKEIAASTKGSLILQNP